MTWATLLKLAKKYEDAQAKVMQYHPVTEHVARRNNAHYAAHDLSREFVEFARRAQTEAVTEGETMTRDELAKALRAGFRSMILDADEWRPLADYVLGIAALSEPVTSPKFVKKSCGHIGERTHCLVCRPLKTTPSYCLFCRSTTEPMHPLSSEGVGDSDWPVCKDKLACAQRVAKRVGYGLREPVTSPTRDEAKLKFMRSRLQAAHKQFHDWCETKPANDVGTYHGKDDDFDPAALMRIIIAWYEKQLPATLSEPVTPPTRDERCEHVVNMHSFWRDRATCPEHATPSPAPEPVGRTCCEATREAAAKEAWTNEPDGRIAGLIRSMPLPAVPPEPTPKSETSD